MWVQHENYACAQIGLNSGTTTRTHRRFIYAPNNNNFKRCCVNYWLIFSQFASSNIFYAQLCSSSCRKVFFSSFSKTLLDVMRISFTPPCKNKPKSVYSSERAFAVAQMHVLHMYWLDLCGCWLSQHKFSNINDNIDCLILTMKSIPNDVRIGMNETLFYHKWWMCVFVCARLYGESVRTHRERELRLQPQ